MQITIIDNSSGSGEKCDANCGEDWSAQETIALVNQRIKDKFGDKCQLQYLDLSKAMANQDTLEWGKTIEDKNRVSPLLLINGQLRIAGLFDIRQLLDAIEAEIEIGA